jgi:hypothetical protein
MTQHSTRYRPPHPPVRGVLPLVSAVSGDVRRWLYHYWDKLRLPADQLTYLAVTQDRGEFALWTGRRLNSLALGCYCYMPLHHDDEADRDDVTYGAAASATLTAPPIAVDLRQHRLPGFSVDDLTDELLSSPADAVAVAHLAPDYRHLIFIEPGMTDLGIEVTVAHELIHLCDRVQGKPRKHRCHGHDSISVDEALVTGRDPELLRIQLRDETERREAVLRELRPYRYVYRCPVCTREYPRVRRFSQPISCGRCDHEFNPAFELDVRVLAKGERYVPRDEAPESPPSAE